MTVNQLIEKLEGLKEAEGGDIEVFMSVKDQDAHVKWANVGRADEWMDEEVFQGHCEEYHQCVVIEGI